MLEFSEKNTGIQQKKVLQKAGSVEKKGKQVVETPRVLTPRC